MILRAAAMVHHHRSTLGIIGDGDLCSAEPDGESMAEYRAFTVDHDGHFTGLRAFVCVDDDEAITWAKIAWAKRLVDGDAVELWSGQRLITRLNPKPT